MAAAEGPGAEEAEAEPAHEEAASLWQAGLARLVRDPLLCDLPAQVTPEEIASQVALEYGQAMTVRVRRADAPQEPMPVVVVQQATVLDLKKAVRRFVQLRQEREGGARRVSWHPTAPGLTSPTPQEARVADLQPGLRQREAGPGPQDAARVWHPEPGRGQLREEAPQIDRPAPPHQKNPPEVPLACCPSPALGAGRLLTAPWMGAAGPSSSGVWGDGGRPTAAPGLCSSKQALFRQFTLIRARHLSRDRRGCGREAE